MKRFQKLVQNFHYKTNKLELCHFATELDCCIKNSDVTVMLPESLSNFLINLYCLKIERNASIWSFNTNLNSYTTDNPNAIWFGGHTATTTWRHNSLVVPYGNESSILASVHCAIQAKRYFNTTTVLVIIIDESNQSLLNLLNDPSLYLQCYWPNNTFEFISIPSYRWKGKEKSKIGIFSTSDMKDKLFNSDLNNLSVRLFNAVPNFDTPSFSKHNIVIDFNVRPIGEDVTLKTQPKLYVDIKEVVIRYYFYILKIPENFLQKLFDDNVVCLHNFLPIHPKLPNRLKYLNYTHINLTVDKVLNIKKSLHPLLVISRKDKNTGQLRVECQILLRKRIQREIYECKCFQPITSGYQAIVRRIRDVYEKYNLKRFGFWRNGSLPCNFTLPKQKDPLNKARLIASFANHFLRNVYRNTSRILTWLFSTIAQRYGFWNLFKLSDIKNKVHKAETTLQKSFGSDTKVIVLQTDINKMYTNLDHKQIILAIKWLIDKAKQIFKEKRKRAASHYQFILIDKYKNNENKYHIRWATSKGDESSHTFTVEDIIDIVKIDLKTAYQARGKDIFKQVHGCPIGGFLSAIYANVMTNTISFKPSRTLSLASMGSDKWTTLSYGLPLIRMTHTHLIKPLKLDTKFLWTTRHIKEVYNLNHNHIDTRRVLLTINLQANNHLHFQCSPHQKNWDSLKESGFQNFPRFIRKTSFTPDHYKYGVQCGTYIRLYEQASTTKILLDALYINAIEMYSLGFDTYFLLKSMMKLTKKSVFWSNIALKFCKMIVDSNIIVGNFIPIKKLYSFLLNYQKSHFLK